MEARSSLSEITQSELDAYFTYNSSFNSSLNSDLHTPNQTVDQHPSHSNHDPQLDQQTGRQTASNKRCSEPLSIHTASSSLLVYLGDIHGAERAVRTAARYAAQLNVNWYVVTIDHPDDVETVGINRHDILAVLRLAESLGAQTSVLFGRTVFETLINHARKLGCTTFVLVRPYQEQLTRFKKISVAQRLATALPEIDVVEILNPSTTTKIKTKRQTAQKPIRSTKTFNFSSSFKAYLLALTVCFLSLILSLQLQPFFESTSIIMLFLLGVIIVGLNGGKGPAALTALINVISFDLFFVGPRLTLSLLDLQYVLTFAVMLGLGLLIGQLTAGLRRTAVLAAQRESQTYALFELTRNLSASLTTEQVIKIGKYAVEQAFGAKAEIILIDEFGELNCDLITEDHTKADYLMGESGFDLRIAKWVLDQKQSAGLSTSFFRRSSWHYIPLDSPTEIRGVLALQPENAQLLHQTEQMRHLQTLANQIAIAEERIHYGKLAQQANIQVEAQELRNTMLSAISHDLRTPLTVLNSMAQTCLSLEPLNERQKQHIFSMIAQTDAITKLANNLLEMARLQSGTLNLRLDWQCIEEVIGAAIRLVNHVNNQEHSFEIKTDIQKDMPLVQFDAVLIERVLVNFIENAIKYGRSPIEIAAKFTHDKLFVSVRDHGEGLPLTLKGREQKLFDTFTRGETESATVGVGLGLAIAKTIVMAHQGEVFAENCAESYVENYVEKNHVENYVEKSAGKGIDRSTNRNIGKGAIFSFSIPSQALPISTTEDAEYY